MFDMIRHILQYLLLLDLLFLFWTSRRLPRRLSLADAVEEEELVLVGGAIHGIEVHARPGFQHRPAMPARCYGLQLLEVGNRHDIREVRLLHHGLHEAHPLRIVILAGLVKQDDINTAQNRRRRPLDLLVRASALVPQHAVNGINLDALDTIHLRELRLERVDKLTRGAYDEDAEASLGTADCNLKQHR